MAHEINNTIAGAISVTPALRTTTVTGTAVDLAGFDAATIYLVPGTITDGTHTPSVEDSDDNSTFSAATLNGTLAAITSNTAQEVGYAGGKRYVRVKVTVTGSPSTGGTYAALVVKGSPKELPA